jgi:hypothetical protein
LLRNLSVALGWVSPQQLRHDLCPRFAVEVAAMDVGADDVVARSGIIASEVRKLGRNLRKLTSTIAIVAVEDFALIANYWLMQAVKLDVSCELVEVLLADLRKDRGERVRF